MSTLIENSEKLLINVKMNSDYSNESEFIANYSKTRLIEELQDDISKKVFWINIYNAYYQILRRDLKVDKKVIYRRTAIEFKDISLSLDNIEHGILRKYRGKYSLGLFPNFLLKNKVKDLAVENIDYRIHFALNCGAKSCPPISFYKLSQLDNQLNLATDSYLEQNTQFNTEKKEVVLSSILQWFKFDFGGNAGIIKMYKKHLDRNISPFKLSYRYDWTEELENFIT